MSFFLFLFLLYKLGTGANEISAWNRLKLKRPQVVKTYRQLLDELYAVPSEESSAPVRSKL